MAYVFAALVFLIIFGVIVIAIDSNRFVVREYTIESDKISENQTFLFISDLHCREYGKCNEKLLSAIDNIKADYALVGGDIMVSRPGRNQQTGVDFIINLCSRMPVYYAYGNHEHRAKIHEKTYKKLFEEFENAVSNEKLVWLDNKSVEIDGVRVTGFTMDEPYYLRKYKLNMKPDYIVKTVGEFHKNSFNIMLAHDPEYFDTYSETGADLVLSGHFHGGIARLPWVGGVISPRFKLFPKYAGGCYVKNGTEIIVSCGLGMHTVPLRFNNPAELTVVHLKKH